MSDYRHTSVPGSNANTIVYDHVGDTGYGTLSGTNSGNTINLISGGSVKYTGTVSGNVCLETRSATISTTAPRNPDRSASPGSREPSPGRPPRLARDRPVRTLGPMSFRPSAESLIAFAEHLLLRAGLDRDKAAAVAAILVEGDLLGHDTHGLALLAPYLAEIEKGGMARTGEPIVVADFPACLTWDGQRLPGPWLVVRALDLAMARARQNGTCTIAIRRSHHIACLAAYLQRVAEQGLMVILSCSDPSVCSVAPFGGRREVFTPNPLAAAWPTAGDPVILDVSMSITTNALTKRLHAEGRRFPGVWAIDAAGRPTDDPAVLFATPPGTLLPIGGIDHGHKGYALALLVETLTGALAGHGRADPKEGWGATVFVQVINPACFGGADEFRRQTSHLTELCRDTPPRPGVAGVRLPGEAGLQRRREQLRDGVAFHPNIGPALRPWAEKLGVTMAAEFA